MNAEHTHNTESIAVAAPERQVTTATSQARLNALETLARRLNEFLADASPEEVLLLTEVLGTRDSLVIPGRPTPGECPLIEAFMRELHQSA